MVRRTGPSQETRNLVNERSRGLCERCYAEAQDIHHRKPRRMGGTRDEGINSPANLVALCRGCHTWVELNRGEALRLGWLLYAKDSPEHTPVEVRFIGSVYLKREGGYSIVEPV